MPFRDLLLVLPIATAWSRMASHVNDLRPSFLLARRRSFAGSSRVVSTATRTCGGRRWLPGIPPSSSASASCAPETSRSWSRSGRIWRREDESNAADVDDASRSPPRGWYPPLPLPLCPLPLPSFPPVSVEVSRWVEHVTSTVQSVASRSPDLHPGANALPSPSHHLTLTPPLPSPLPPTC